MNKCYGHACQRAIQAYRSEAFIHEAFMAQEFSNWNDVPAQIEARIRKIWSGLGTSCHEPSFDRNNSPITVYKLANYTVAENIDFLSDAQKMKLFDLAASNPFILKDFLHNLNFEIETIRVHDEVYHLPAFIVGTWPHCKLYGCMDDTGYIHT